MLSRTTYKIKRPSVAVEDLGAEVVAVSFASGRYFSLRGTGAETWRMIEKGMDFRSIVSHYSQVAANVEAPISEFIQRLLDHELIEPSDEVPDDEVPDADADLPAPERFEKPQLEEFDEMKEMLLYDPIHDVDETGWPNLPEPSTFDDR